jgi:hypothetical protein
MWAGIFFPSKERMSPSPARQRGFTPLKEGENIPFAKEYRSHDIGIKVLFFYTDICLTFELLRSMTSNVILFKCHLSLIGGLLNSNFFYCSEIRFYTSSNLYFIKQDHQIATIDIQRV